MEQRNSGYGIYLGAEHASIAYADGKSIMVFKNSEGHESIPSAVFIGKNNELIVGRKAKEQVESDPENVFEGFIQQMGIDLEPAQPHVKCPSENEFERAMHQIFDFFEGRVKEDFQRSRRWMKPEALSAEVLKTLLASVQHRTGHRPEAAVITVPVDFELAQYKATTQAAKLAGLQVSPLLQEPIAAALAYGFQNERDGAYWLVYDFGGGTFDAAVIALRDGMIEVLTHERDNFLGGKDIDWAIVDELLIPAVTQKFQVADFGRMKAKWRGAIAKLKGAAEKAKIQLSTAETADIDIDFLWQDDQREPIEFQYSISRRDFERVVEPFISRSIQICRSVLEQCKLMPHTIGKMILVGAATRMPYLRQRLEQELKIPLEFRIDPMTIMLQGAALFASTQRLETAPTGPTVQEEFALILEWKRMGPEREPFLGGTVLGATTSDFCNYTIEFINQTAVPSWRSGKIKLSTDGAFLATLWSEKGKVNRFTIELQNTVGTLCKTTSNYWDYEIALSDQTQESITSSKMNEPDQLTEHAFLIEGLKALYGRNPHEGAK